MSDDGLYTPQLPYAKGPPLTGAMSLQDAIRQAGVSDHRAHITQDTEPRDVYQERYAAHQGRKRATLIKLIEERHSDRLFSHEPVSVNVLEQVWKDAQLYCASSCDRKGVHHSVHTGRDDKELMAGLLVGGVGWLHRAPAVFTLWADPAAYKAGGEGHFMPYIDAGIVVHQLYLSILSFGLKGCYVNPNIRPRNEAYFHQQFSPMLGPDAMTLAPVGIYCGAFAIGWPRTVEE